MPLQNFKLTWLGLSLCFWSSYCRGEEPLKFMLPISPDGQEIRSAEALTGQRQPGSLKHLRDFDSRGDAALQDKTQKTTKQNVHNFAKDAIEEFKHSEPAASEKPNNEELVEQKNERFRQLQNQLQELSSMWEAMRHKESPASQEILPQSQSEHHPGNQTGDSPDKTDLAEASPPPSLGLPDAASSASRSSPEDEIGMTIQPPSENIVTGSMERPPTDIDPELNARINQPRGQPAINGPIDRFALASSLYATGHFRECLQVIDAADQATLNLYETRWLEYLKAGCLRQLGNSELAQRIYRRLVTDESSDWIAEISRWWLDQIQHRQTLQADYSKLASAINQWEQAVDELTKTAQ